MNCAPLSDIRLNVLLLPLVFLALLLQVYPSTLLAAKNASGWFTPHCDGASFYLSNVDGLPSEQKLNLNMRHYALPWWNYRPQEVGKTCMRNDVYPQENVKRPPTQESGWIKGTQTTNVFQENTLWNSADSILKGDSSLNIERKRPLGFAND